MTAMNGKKSSEIRHISDIVGEWGKWQRDLTIVVFIMISLYAYYDLGYSFHSYETKFWCEDFSSDLKNESQVNGCYKYENSTESCEQWTFDRSEFDKTIISEFDLVCDRSEYASISQSLFMFGTFISGVLLSQFADKYGRKPLVLVSFFGFIVSLICCALSANIIQYSISRFFLGLSIYGCSGAMCTSLLESCGPKHRSDIYMLAGFGWIFGYVIIPVIAYWLKDFRLMNIYGIVPVVFTLVWFYFIPESPRWLITSGRIESAEQTLRYILKRNQMSDENFDQKFLELKTHLLKDQANERSQKSYNFLHLLKTPNIRKYTLIFWYSWFAMGLVYYGFSLNMSDFGGNFYLTFSLSGVVELPSVLITILVLRYMPRRKATITFQVIIALSSLAIIPTTDPTLMVTFALIGKFAVGSIWWVNEIFVPEVYPTLLRNTGSGSAASFGGLGSMAAPFMKNLSAKTSLTVVMILYSIISSISAVLVIFLPETKGTEIPDSLDEVENPKENII